MALVTLSRSELTSTEATVALTGSLSTTNTYRVKNTNGTTILAFRKSGAGADTVTLVTPGTEDGNAVAEKTWSVPATTGDIMVTLEPKATYNDSDGYATFTHSEVTGLTHGAFVVGA